MRTTPNPLGERLFRPQSGDLATASALLTSLPQTSNPFREPASDIHHFRERLEEHKKEELSQSFRGSFVPSGTVESEVLKPTVSFLQPPQKRSRWDN